LNAPSTKIDKSASGNLRQQVYEQIKHDIISCKLSPGQPISEIQFVDRFQVSKTPIREALTSLEQDHLVEYIPNRGFTVANISFKDIQEIYEARIFFESALIKLAVKHITLAEIEKLEGYAEIQYDWNDKSNIDAYLQDNLDFHLNIARAAHNNRLFWHYRTLLNEAQRLIYMDFISTNVIPIWSVSHKRFTVALRNHDEAAGVLAIEETLENAKKRLLNS
jgi:DNA-binding GntR family transcriptional regulator